jgi:two-component system CheB/CheR fusion protein
MYLEPAPGRASLNLLKMARKGMEFALRNTVGKAIKLGKAARTEGIEIKYKDTGYNITIEAVPLVDEEEGDERHYLVLFSENKAALPVGGGATLLKNKRIIQLEQELATLHSDMRSIIEEREVASEELQSANEEVTSSNEELQSINEELETSKEELESANEELMSYNQELQTTNQQLTATEEYSQAVISTVAESMLVLDKNLCIQSINPSFVQTFNINEESAQGQYVYKLDGGRWDMPELRDLLQKVLPATGSVRGFEISHDFPDLGAKNLMLNAQKLINKTGEELIFISIRDITSSVRARVISERNAWFEKLADDAPALIWVAGTNRKRTFFNKHWYEFTGRTFEQEVGDGWAETIHPDDLERCLDVYARSFEQRENFSMEYRRLRHDGEYRWLMVTGRPTFAPDGEFTGYVGICVDIHEQRKNAAQLMETTTQLLTLMEAMPQIVWTARPDGYLDFYNKRWYDYTGLSKGFDDSNWEKLIHPADLQRAIDTHYGSMKSGKPYQIELRFADREQPGAYRWFLCIGMPVRDDNGEIVKWIGTCTDIDDQKLKYHAIELHGLGYEMKFHSSMNVLSRLSFWF